MSAVANVRSYPPVWVVLVLTGQSMQLDEIVYGHNDVVGSDCSDISPSKIAMHFRRLCMSLGVCLRTSVPAC